MTQKSKIVESNQQKFVELLEESVGHPPQFNEREPAEMQYLGWVKWSGRRQVLDDVKQKLGDDSDIP